MNTVKEYRKAGYKVRVTHYRYAADIHNLACAHMGRKKDKDACYLLLRRDVIRTEMRASDSMILHPKGGLTVVEISHPTLFGTDGKPFTVVGEAKCNRCDNYRNDRGVKIALGRINQDELTENYN